MEVHILSKIQFDNLMKQGMLTDETIEAAKPNICFISIVDTVQFSESRKPHFKQNHENVINLEFDDIITIGQHSPTNTEECILFDKQMAKDLFQFIKKHRDKKACIVHCMAGISRSGAVGTFINGYAGGDWNIFHKNNPYIHPNQLVLNMLNTEKENDRK